MIAAGFLQVLDMTKTGTIVILAVLLARLLVKRLPKAVSYALWAVVLFRLLCPVSLAAPFGVVPQTEPATEETYYTISDTQVSFSAAASAVGNTLGGAANGGPGVQTVPSTEKDVQGGPVSVEASWWEVWALFGKYLAPYIWAAGAAGLALSNAVRYILLRRRLVGAVLLRDNIYLADHIGTPFVLGLLRPKIYLPSGLSGREQSYIILHEQYHIKRLDHVAKAAAFLALCLHWFNPLVWAAFVLSVRDMEMSCDEAVVRRLGENIRAEYSASLLSLSTGRRVVAGTPLAFGEGDVRRRIKNMLNWKKPSPWALGLAVLLCAVVIAACAFNRSERPSAVDDPPIPSMTAAPVPAPEGEDGAEAVRRIVDSVFAGGGENGDWQTSEPYTITATDHVTGRVDAYTVTPLYGDDSPGDYYSTLFAWTVVEPTLERDEVAEDYSFCFEKGRYSVTAYSAHNLLRLEENGTVTYVMGVPHFDSQPGKLSDVCSRFMSYAENARYDCEYAACSVSGGETDYAAVAQSLAEQYARQIAARPGWMPLRAEEVQAAETEVLDVYFGEETNMCFDVPLYVRGSKEQLNWWRLKAELSGPLESGPYAGCGMGGCEVRAYIGEDGDWHIGSIQNRSDGGAMAWLPYASHQLPAVPTEQLMELYVLTAGNSHDRTLPYYLVRRPLAEVQAALEQLEPETALRAAVDLLTYIEANPDGAAWSSLPAFIKV